MVQVVTEMFFFSYSTLLENYAVPDKVQTFFDYKTFKVKVLRGKLWVYSELVPNSGEGRAVETWTKCRYIQFRTYLFQIDSSFRPVILDRTQLLSTILKTPKIKFLHEIFFIYHVK